MPTDSHEPTETPTRPSHDDESFSKCPQSFAQPQVQSPVTTANILNHGQQGSQSSDSFSGDSGTLVGGTGYMGERSTGSDKLPEQKIFPGIVHERAQRGSVLNRSTAEEQ